MTEQLALLRRMRQEGQITDRGLEDAVASLVNVRAGHPSNDGSENPDAAAETPLAGVLPRPVLRDDISSGHFATLLATEVVLIVASTLGMLTWLITVPVILVSLTTLFDGWERLTLVGSTAGAVLVVIGVVVPLAEPPSASLRANPMTIPVQDPETPAKGSLRIHMDRLADSWNGVDSEPRIVKGLTLHNETGEYDTFIYRFGEWGRVAGAYDPDTEAIYALLVAGQLSAVATEQLYLHLCFVVAPYSQDCIDSYHHVGLDGGVLADFTDESHEAEWTLGQDTWRLGIEGNVLTIRVFGSDAVP